MIISNPIRLLQYTSHTHMKKSYCNVFTNTWQLVKPRVICEYLSGSSNSPYVLADEKNCYQIQEDRIALIIMGFRYSTDPIMCPCACPGDVAWKAVSSPEYFYINCNNFTHCIANFELTIVI